MMQWIRRLTVIARALRHARGLAERERWPIERREADKRERLTELVAHAAGRSPYYRKALAGYDPAVGVASLPALSRATMMEPSTTSSAIADCAATPSSNTWSRCAATSSTSAATAHDDERLVGAQGTLRLRRARLDRRSGPVPVLQRRQRDPAAHPADAHGTDRRRDAART